MDLKKLSEMQDIEDLILDDYSSDHYEYAQKEERYIEKQIIAAKYRKAVYNMTKEEIYEQIKQIKGYDAIPAWELFTVKELRNYLKECKKERNK